MTLEYDISVRTANIIWKDLTGLKLKFNKYRGDNIISFDNIINIGY